MLSNNVVATPRPRPPAKTRVKLRPTSPPRSDFHFPSDSVQGTLLGSPVSLTAQMAGWDSHNRSQQHCQLPDDSNWINPASREELHDIFTKADDLIKARESELSMTSAVCRSLYDHNVALKNKHEALLARIPGTPAQSTTSSPIPYTTPLIQSPHYYSDSLLEETEPTASNDTPPSRSRIRHNRRISVCPLDIALLSDQNAELLDKVEKLESESTQADQIGRRALKKLEKEIQDLRDELERTQAKGDELEEKARVGFGISAEKLMEEMLKQREEREHRLKALRHKPGDSEDDEEGEREIRDFAPGGALWITSPSYDRPSVPAARQFPTSPPPDINLATKPISPPVMASYDSCSSSLSIASLPEHEYAVVSQLLFKIRELEETNAQIRTQQAETATKLRAVHRDTRRISKLYECLGDQSGVEWEAEGQIKSAVADDIIRFQSLRKSLEKDLSDPAADDDVFGDSIAKNHSTVRGPVALNFNTIKRTRKTVVGLFDTPTSETTLPEPPLLDTRLPLSLLPPADPDTSRMSWLMGVSSPALSEISLGTQTLTGTSLSVGPGRTLGSELGSDFGDDWGFNAGSHHLRKTSLYDLCQLSSTRSSSPMRPDHVKQSAPEPPGGPQTPELAVHAIQLGVDTPTPKPSKGGGQLIRRQTNRKLNNTPEADYAGAEDEEMHILDKPLTPVKGGSSAFDVMMETFTEQGQDTTLEHQSTGEVVHVSNAVERSRRTKRESMVALMLEVWLWLQFIIIILVFLWAMAKRGPKTILNEAEHRRTRL